jgi:hypothetical protein
MFLLNNKARFFSIQGSNIIEREISFLKKSNCNKGILPHFLIGILRRKKKIRSS